MPIKLPRDLIEHILLGPTGDRRQLQDSPILVDVWIAYAKDPVKPQELLITPHKEKTAGSVATRIDERMDERIKGVNRSEKEPAEIAYLQGIIAARLYFDELLEVIVPMTEWWKSPRNKKDLKPYLKTESGLERLNKIFDIVANMVAQTTPTENQRGHDNLSALDRYAALAGLTLWARRKDTEVSVAENETEGQALKKAINKGMKTITEGLQEIFLKILEQFPPERENENDNLIYQVSLNREATQAVARSVPAVKADAAKGLFSVKCSKIAWAVIDSGIQGNHDAFKTADGKSSRVKASFDFKNFRKIVSFDTLKILSGVDEELKRERLTQLCHDDLKNKPSEKNARELLTNLAMDAKNKRPIHWESVRPFIEIKIETRPEFSDHGTHVAGIIGAGKQKDKGEELPKEEQDDNVDGMCPDIQLYDFRVLAPSIKETEFAIIAALQYIRYLNDQNEFISIHGANLSLSIPHDVRNYACGLTPVCIECERLVESGVVVVAAAGNLGYQSFQTKEGFYEGYAALSITDPGNADGVITVGATHRYSPHTYGVSFFSSRGPTGDGRLKPDLVAPGERIHAPFREDWGDLDGTSMAAPHVSGAAAMLMARFPEFIARPRRIKEILCQSATDLGRERSFQGHGMLDVLRAFQSI